MCSFAKFLALGLIASEGHGPVFAEATATFSLVDEGKWKAAMGLETVPTDKQGLGAGISWNVASAQADLCVTMNDNYENLMKGSALDENTWNKNHREASPPKCSDEDYGKICGTMLAAWKQEAKNLMLTIDWSGLTVDNPIATNAKAKLIKALRAKRSPGVADPSDPATSYYTQIKALKKEITDVNPAPAAATTETETEKADDEAAATVGGVFGVLAGLAIAFVGLLFSPCFQYDFKNHAFDWEETYQKPKYYEELEGDARHWRNEVNEAFGLPEEQPPKEPAGKVDSAAASSSALTLVPVVVLAGGVFAVARRGLNKRRAQKKAKRVSRAQQKLHEDL